MKLSRLTEYGISERFLARWGATTGAELLDWQADAVRAHDLCGRGSLIVVAPTSSGKTFLAEVAAAGSLARRRGPVVASLCDVLAAAARPPRVLMLASHLPQAEALSRYLRAPVLTVRRRPVELRLGVLHEGRFRFREHNSAETGEEALPWDSTLPEAERPLALLDALAHRGERILVFCPSKSDCHRRAQALAERRAAAPVLTEEDRWAIRSGPSLAGPLAHWLEHGVGVHHADLTPHQRTLVERLFARGQLAALFCTGTLAWGVNLPATVAFVDAEKYSGGPYTGHPVPTPLARLEFEGMAGRAGRLGLSGNAGAPGRGVLWSHSECEAELLWQAYIAPEASAPEPAPMAVFPPERRLLDWVVCGLARRLEDAAAIAARSPFAGAAAASPSLERALARLARAGLVVVDPEGYLSSTPRGAIAATAGIGLETAAALTRALDAASDFDPALWIAFLATRPEAAEARLTQPPPREAASVWLSRFGEDFLTALGRRFAHDPAAVTGAFATAAAQARAILTALVLDDWMHGVDTRQIEQRYRLPVGRLEPVADTLSWLLETAGAWAQASPATARFAREFTRAAFRTRHGLPESAATLVEALGGLLPRQTLLELLGRGWDDPAALAQREAADLAALIPLPVAERTIARCRAWTQKQIAEIPATERGMRDAHSAAGRGEFHVPHSADKRQEEVMSPILQLDGAGHRARMSVQLEGRTLMLRAKSFKYLLALAAARLLTRDGWINKTEIEPGENQIKYFYQLRRELSAAGPRADTLIENDGRGHYRLTLPPQAIRFDLPRLATHPDWDIRSRAEQLLQAGMANQAA
jgi:hypothetical protein